MRADTETIAGQWSGAGRPRSLRPGPGCPAVRYPGAGFLPVPAADPGRRRTDGHVHGGAGRRALQPVHHPRRGARLARRQRANGAGGQSRPLWAALRGPGGGLARGLPRGPGREIPEGEPVLTIELRNVSRWYGNVVAVNDITMSIGPGVTGLLGPNGAGKSTIMHMIAGFCRRPAVSSPSATGQAAAARPGAIRPSTARSVWCPNGTRCTPS